MRGRDTWMMRTKRPSRPWTFSIPSCSWGAAPEAGAPALPSPGYHSSRNPSSGHHDDADAEDDGTAVCQECFRQRRPGDVSTRRCMGERPNSRRFLRGEGPGSQEVEGRAAEGHPSSPQRKGFPPGREGTPERAGSTELPGVVSATAGGHRTRDCNLCHTPLVPGGPRGYAAAEEEDRRRSRSAIRTLPSIPSPEEAEGEARVPPEVELLRDPNNPAPAPVWAPEDSEARSPPPSDAASALDPRLRVSWRRPQNRSAPSWPSANANATFLRRRREGHPCPRPETTPCAWVWSE
mmetsp:Transcript_19362/g.56597  ORF Transcript_19362/g.56597 Transcript_19362/m.56597 type:complete len:293 (+) Transcript_19362:715-1593(+)